MYAAQEMTENPGKPSEKVYLKVNPLILPIGMHLIRMKKHWHLAQRRETLYMSNDYGENWNCLNHNLPMVHCLDFI